MRKLFAALAVFALVSLPSAARFVAAAETEDSNYGLDTSAEEAYCPTSQNCTGTAENSSLALFIGTRIIAPVLGFVGTVFFCLMLYGGFLWMTARGNPKQIQTAKDVLVAAVIGVVIITASYAITRTLFNELS